jgi:hypothetical protein
MSDDLGYLDLSPARVRKWSEWTESQLEGCVVSAARVVGNRRIEQIVADRERRLVEMRRRAIKPVSEGRR